MLLAAPSEIVSKLAYLTGKGYLQMNIAATLGRFIAGFIIATALAVPLGIALVYSKKFMTGQPLF
jgi:ABC-type nitrate/sulfonate/bicarbonate transport system permease component